MVRTLAFVAVRQQHDQRGQLAPFVARRDDKLVDHRLGIVDEVAVLRLPDHQLVGGLHVKAKLEAQRGVFRERRIVRSQRQPWPGAAPAAG